jgi:hypothetical protein
MAKFYFTFGSSETHVHPGCVQPIEADDWAHARRAMFALYGDKWAFQYTEEEWERAKNRAEGSMFTPALETEVAELNADDILKLTNESEEQINE